MPKIIEKSSDNRLIAAVIDQWEMIGHEGISARQLSAVASIPASSIYHHFGSLEQLLVLAQEQAQRQARAWCDDRLQQIAGIPRDGRAFASFFAALVDDWTRAQRTLAFAWREGQLLRTESHAGRDLRLQWQGLWRAFWQEATDRFGLGHGAMVADRLFENESFLHMIGWRRAVDRAGLDEFAGGVAAWLAGAAAPPSPWRDFARGQALEAAPAAPTTPGHDDTTARIVAAAAALIGEAGPTGLTHRAVADQAGLTLGVVSHKMRTKAQLLQAGYEGIYIAAASRLRAQASMPAPGNRSMTPAVLAAFLAQSLGGKGIDALHLAVARDPALAQFGLQMRYLRGAASRGLLHMLMTDRPEPGHLDAALLSSFLSSLVRGHADCTSAQALAPIQADIEAMVALLRERAHPWASS